jgi:hypothetical protein
MSVGRVTAKTKIYEIKIELREVRPAVLRRVQVPGELSLAGLHAVVQVAMGWTDSHLHEFDVDGARYGLPDPDWDAGEAGQVHQRGTGQPVQHSLRCGGRPVEDDGPGVGPVAQGRHLLGRPGQRRRRVADEHDGPGRLRRLRPRHLT